MISGLFDFYGDPVKKALKDDTIKRLRVAAEVVRGNVVKLLSVSGHTKTKIREKEFPFRYRVVYIASKPNEPPHLQTGTLRKSIYYRVDESKLTARVGTNLRYGFFLEIGTTKMNPRPFLRPGLWKSMERIKRIFSTPLPSPPIPPTKTA